MKELVKGVLFQSGSEALQVFRTPGMDLHLLTSWDGTEIIRQVVPRDRQFGLRPEDGWDALECLYILEGTAVWEQDGQTVILRPGDSLSGRPVGEPCILRALTDLVALYICSRPVFHLISDELGKLNEMAVQVELKDGYTSDHCWRIQNASAKVGKLLNLSPARQHNLLYGSLLHDLGKVGIPDGILNKPGKLTDAEWATMKRHTLIGRDMLMNTAFASAAFILEQHHERLDGSGYPHGLRGSEIPLESQIVAVVDSFDAMTSNRVYRPALSLEEAIAELQRGSERLYNPEVVEAFLTLAPDYIVQGGAAS